jgi:Fe-S-cluster containining protein
LCYYRSAIHGNWGDCLGITAATVRSCESYRIRSLTCKYKLWIVALGVETNGAWLWRTTLSDLCCCPDLSNVTSSVAAIVGCIYR